MTKLHGRNNNIGFIRLVAALMVVYSHSVMWPYGRDVFQQVAKLDTYVFITYGLIAVFTFFILSGFLVAKSWVNTKDIQQFVRKRFLRIYPAYLVNFLLMMLLLGGIVVPSFDAYFAMVLEQKVQILGSLIFPHPPNMLKIWLTNPDSPEMNPALWTLPYELWLYGMVLLIGVSGGFSCSKKIRYIVWVVGVVVVFSITWRWMLYINPYSIFAPLMACLGFVAGMMYYVLYDAIAWSKILMRWGLFLMGLWQVSIFVALIPDSWRMLVALFMTTIVLPYLVIYFAFSKSPKWMQNIERHGDYSYGIYLYHFPVMQGVIHLWGAQLSFAQFLMISLPIIFLLSAFSWHVVEKRALLWGRR